MQNMNAVDWAVFILVVVGGLNWGLVGLFEIDLVASLLGEGSGLSRVVYSVVGLATIYLLASALIPRNSDAAI